MLGAGSAAGGMYRPAFVIIPTVALPPAIPLTDQVTAMLLVPLTVSENCWAGSPARTLSVAGVTETVTEPVELAPLPPDAQASRKNEAHHGRKKRSRKRRSRVGVTNALTVGRRQMGTMASSNSRTFIHPIAAKVNQLEMSRCGRMASALHDPSAWVRMGPLEPRWIRGCAKVVDFVFPGSIIELSVFIELGG